MDIVEKGLEFEQRKHKFITTSDRILASREVKALILGIIGFSGQANISTM